MDTIPADIIGYIMGFCRVSLAFLVCRKWRDLYIVNHKSIRFPPRFVLLKINTTKWFIETNIKKELTDIQKVKIYQYAAVYSPIDVISYLTNKGCDDEKIYSRLSDDEKKTIGSDTFHPNFYLGSLNLDKIKWYFSSYFAVEDPSILLAKLNINFVIKKDKVPILEYLHSIGYKFTYIHLLRAASTDSLDCFKYIKGVSGIVTLDRKMVKQSLNTCADSDNGTKVAHYLLDNLSFELNLSDNRKEDIIHSAVMNHNLELIKLLHSKGIRHDNIGEIAASVACVQILKWVISMKIPINKQEAMRDVTLMKDVKLRDTKRLQEKEKLTKLQQIDLKSCKEHITALDSCIALLESLP